MADTSVSAPTPPSPAKKNSLGKWIFRLFGLLVVLIIIGLVVLFLSLNGLVRAGVVRGGQYATDQTTSLDAADMKLFAGTLGLSQLDIANLKAYKEKNILSMKQCDVIVQPGSLFTDTVVVNSIAINGLELTLEQNGTNNDLADLIEVLKKKTAATGDTANTSPGKKLKITTLDLAATKVHIRANPINLDLDLGPIHLDDPMNPDGRPMKIADLIGKILIHISAQLVDNPQLPAVLKDQMKNVTALVNNLRGELDKETAGMKKLQTDLQGLTTNPAGALKDVQNLGKDSSKDLKNLGNLFNNGKKDAPK